MSALPVSIVCRISAWSCWIRMLANSGATGAVRSIAISDCLAAITASAAVTTVVIIVFVVVTDVAVATVSEAPLASQPERSAAIPPTRWIAWIWFSKPSGRAAW